ncbi:MFS transporter [Paraburkholderia sp. RL17-337-BIB-A]|uniref:MFS transporter n=1 Tax=Paraburkholderia sp. RL17-337-BIB-A TaxID=3031636 RepID=UPI0038BA2D40
MEISESLGIAEVRPSPHRAIVATVIGNGLEWFDFTVYSYFAVILAKVFFPTGNDFSSLLLAVATFGVGFFMRPIGGIVLGVYADKKGRKAAMTLTIMIMAAGTTLIAVTPSYESIGPIAPLIIVVARLMQGFSAGGEMGTAAAFLTEHAPEGRRAYYSSWVLSSIGFAVLLGAAAGTFVTTVLDPASVRSWGWRLPFLLGLLIGPVGFYFRSRITETPVYENTTHRVAASPLRESITTHARDTFGCFAMVMLWTVAIYVLLFYMPTYAASVLHLPPSDGFISGMVGGFAMMCSAPLAGLLADRVGPGRVLAPSAVLVFLLAWPMFTYINAVPGLSSLLVFQAVFGILTGTYTGPILYAFSRRFPSPVLATAISIAYNFGVTVFGGFAAFFVTWLIVATGSTVAPAYYVMLGAAFSLVGMWLLRRSD